VNIKVLIDKIYDLLTKHPSQHYVSALFFFKSTIYYTGHKGSPWQYRERETTDP